MKSKLVIGTIALILFILVIAFTNDRVQEVIPRANIFLGVFLIALILLAVYSIFLMKK